jgi:hypothetical protein
MRNVYCRLFYGLAESESRSTVGKLVASKANQVMFVEALLMASGALADDMSMVDEFELS